MGTDHEPDGTFHRALKALNHGQTEAELDEAVRELTASVQRLGKAGTLTLKLTIQPLNQDGYGPVRVVDDVTVKAPKANRPVSMLFPDESHGLQLENPYQRKMDLKEVNEQQGPLKEVPESEKPLRGLDGDSEQEGSAG